MPPAQTYTITRRRYDEVPVPGKPLGRHVLIDSRSRAFPYQRRRARAVASVEHKRFIPILDQGSVGSCTGNAETGALGTHPIWQALPAGHPALNEPFARDVLYHMATQLDGYPGTYPPQDTGSDGTSVNKAAAKLGLISGYTHAGTVTDALDALADGPVTFGVDWYDSFDEPDSAGLIVIGKSAGVRGGHEIVGRRIDADRKLIGLDNSWGTGYGDGGSMWISWDDMDTLLSTDGDAVVPVPLTAPAPTPQPVDDPNAVFAAVLEATNAAGQAWVDQRHSGYAVKVARAGRTWLNATGR